MGCYSGTAVQLIHVVVACCTAGFAVDVQPSGEPAPYTAATTLTSTLSMPAAAAAAQQQQQQAQQAQQDPQEAALLGIKAALQDPQGVLEEWQPSFHYCTWKYSGPRWPSYIACDKQRMVTNL
jgi:Leucine rich repeat N-terminal domain